LSLIKPPRVKFSLGATLSIGGSSTGRDVYVTARSRPTIDMSPGIGNDWRYLPRPNGKLTFQAIRPLHPGEEVDLFGTNDAKFITSLHQQSNCWVVHWESVEFDFEVFVADQQRRTIRLMLEAGTSSPDAPEGTLEAKLLASEFS
jgi:hypothetical protein